MLADIPPAMFVLTLRPQSISELDVLKAASEDSRSVLLVYALDKALAPRDIQIPDGLKVECSRFDSF